MNDTITYTDVKRAVAQHEVARQLALEKWMEAVTSLLVNLKYTDIEAWHKLLDALEEYKRVSKP